MSEPRVVSPGFHARVYARVREVEPGYVTTYGDVAAALGTPRVARHVGWALSALDDDSTPWHRVINSQGRISYRGDTGRGELQRALLEAEGIVFRGDRVDMRSCRWRFEPG
ncbi:MAG: MGMT family protein [Alphaproteobacteria bacterium]|nr:MGMT family protein [Alphaproteobacteria bacterium]MCB9692683.1 MGMT family protein [Alphaproteobacteria bacterium]